jgi:hypothetical protein
MLSKQSVIVAIMISLLVLLPLSVVAMAYDYDDSKYYEDTIYMPDATEFQVLVNKKTNSVDYIWLAQGWATPPNPELTQRLYLNRRTIKTINSMDKSAEMN